MTRKMIWRVSLIYFIVLGVLGVVIYQASPGPDSQEILGVSIGDRGSAGGNIYLSGRRLSCFPLEETHQFAVTCSVELAGQPLEIQARRNAPSASNQFGGTCQAFYNGQVWPCALGWRHVHVPWFAYVPSLGLSSAQLISLSRQYPVENQPEAVFLISLVVVPLATAAVMGLLVVSWTRARGNKRWLLNGLPAGVITLIGTFLVWYFLTNAFWD